MKARRLSLERLEARLAMAIDGFELPMPGGEIGAAAAAESPCELECERTQTLDKLNAELGKRDAALSALWKRLTQASGDVVESERLQLWIDGWNQYGQTLNTDVSAAEAAQTVGELTALQEKYRLTTSGLLPITEMGDQTHLGFSGGLYPGGSDEPPAELAAAGLERAEAIVPRNAAGEADPTSGRVVLVSIGMSNTNQEFGAFISRANAYPGKHRQLSIINGAQGGRDADDWVDPNSNTWSNIDATLAGNGLTAAQVQIAWVKQARAGPNGLGGNTAAIDVLRDDLEDIARNVKIHFPNIQIAYISSRTRAYTDARNSLNPEPFAYESAFAVQQLIGRQIAGQADLNHDPGQGPVVAPLLLWGPYVWADGTQSREDGFAWLPHDVAADRTHPATSGRQKVAYELLRFFTTETTAVSWFTDTPLPMGDLNADGSVNLTDLWTLQRNVNRAGAATAGRGDLNGDQRVDRVDIALFARHWGESITVPAGMVAAVAAPATGQANRPLRASRSSQGRALPAVERFDMAVSGALLGSRR